MARTPAFARAFAGRWRIVEMDVWDNDFLDLVAQAHLPFEGETGGEIAFGALKGFLDVRYRARDGAACAESWEGYDDNDPACGRGTKAMTQASCANPTDFFNSLLGVGNPWNSVLVVFAGEERPPSLSPSEGRIDHERWTNRAA